MARGQSWDPAFRTPHLNYCGLQDDVSQRSHLQSCEQLYHSFPRISRRYHLRSMSVSPVTLVILGRWSTKVQCQWILPAGSSPQNSLHVCFGEEDILCCPFITSPIPYHFLLYALNIFQICFSLPAFLLLRKFSEQIQFIPNQCLFYFPRGQKWSF